MNFYFVKLNRELHNHLEIYNFVVDNIQSDSMRINLIL